MRSSTRLVAIVAIGAGLIWAAAAYTGIGWDEIRHYGQPRNVLDDNGTSVPIPLPDGPSERLLPAVPVTSNGEHSFLFDDGGEPIRYDPCRPLGWVVNPDGAPAGAVDLVHSAVDDVEQSTGLDFEYLGETDEVASFERSLFQDRYGSGFAPIIIGFSTEDATPDLAGSVTGVGGSSAVSGAYGVPQYLRSGVVIMDADDVAEIQEQSTGEWLAQAIVRHELGHVVGLGHVADTAELMNAENMRTTEWGPGDRQGLAIAGNGPCEPA